MSEKITVGIADMKLAKGSGILITYALGSCIGLCFHDQRLNLGALLHIMLPLNMEAGRKNPLKYADTGIRETLRQMEANHLKKILFAPTGALLSPTSSFQGESIPAICHALTIEK